MTDPALPADHTPTHLTETQIRNPRLLRSLRVGWIVLAGITLILFVYSLFQNYAARLGLPVTGFEPFLTPFGLDGAFLAGYITVVNLLTYLPFVSMGLNVFARKSDHLITLLASLAMLLMGATFVTREIDAPVFYMLAALLALAFFYTFPHGHFTPRWTLGLLIVQLVIDGLFIQPRLLAGENLLSYTRLLILFLPPLLLQIQRYLHLPASVQRQQIKWAVFGMTLALLGFTFPAILFALVPPSTEQPGVLLLLYWLFGYPLRNLLLCAMPVGIGLAVLRNRLYDIDLVLNRSLVFGAVTLLLALVFILAAAVRYLVLRVIAPEQTLMLMTFSAVVSGLVFNPLRRYIQGIIDRRVFGLRFNLHELHAANDLPAIEHSGFYTGRTLDGYHIRDVLGKGGMGEVYQAVTDDGRVAAIKILASELAQQPEFRLRFQREADMTQRLQHPNIVRLYGSGEDNGVAYLALEYVAGGTLKDHLQQHERLTITEAATMLQPLADALDYAHTQGIVHRDLKPSNIMLKNAHDGTLHPILMDFGVAHLRDATTALTGSGAIGTIDYMAPEQILEARKVGEQADIYALGVMLYEMLTGEKPFKGAPAQVMFAHLQQPAPDPRDLVGEMPRHVAKAIQRAMAKDPSERFASAGEFTTCITDSP
jgi:predicted Ser/Thr protein kinase